MTFPGFILQHRMAGGEWRLGMRLCGDTKSSCNIIAGVCVSGEWSLGMRLLLTLAHETPQTDLHRFDVVHKRRG